MFEEMSEQPIECRHSGPTSTVLLFLLDASQLCQQPRNTRVGGVLAEWSPESINDDDCRIGCRFDCRFECRFDSRQGDI